MPDTVLFIARSWVTRTRLLPSKVSPSGEGYWDINNPLLNDAINPTVGVYIRDNENTEEQEPNCPEGKFREGFPEEVTLSSSLMKSYQIKGISGRRNEDMKQHVKCLVGSY